ncbi:MAG: mechanosensitive ion channel family protein [Candidatus Heimdallarchaeota archaeon]|nr:MAG: mechanosensitive ion channel family protein [Candidatus Heimdallarchaeota archaeon]
MKINKTQLLYSFIFLIFILVMISIHNLGLDETLATTVDDITKQPGTYITLFTLFVQLITWIFIAMVLLLIWGSMLEALAPRMTKTVINTLRVLGRMIIIPFCVIAYLNNFPAFEGTLIGISALLGTAIGFASTTTMGNFLAGLYIMATRPFLIGDYIILPDSKTEGRVKEITVNYTKMTLPTGNTILVSNSKFLGQSIINTRTTEDHLILRKDQDRRFVYPLMWGANSDEKHAWAVEAIEKTGEEFNERLSEPITWYVYSRNRLDKIYQVNLASDSATKLLDITGNFMTALTRNYDEIRDKFKI